MDGIEYAELQSALDHVNRKCKILKYLCGILLVLLGAAAIITLVALITRMISADVNYEEITGMTHAILYCLIGCALVYTIFQSFADIVAGSSPFTEKQASRFRFSALMLVLFTAVDAFLPTGLITSLDFFGSDVAFYGSNETQLPIKIDFLPLFFAAILYGVSILIRYGTLLQRLTDETA